MNIVAINTDYFEISTICFKTKPGTLRCPPALSLWTHICRIMHEAEAGQLTEPGKCSHWLLPGHCLLSPVLP